MPDPILLFVSLDSLRFLHGLQTLCLHAPVLECETVIEKLGVLLWGKDLLHLGKIFLTALGSLGTTCLARLLLVGLCLLAGKLLLGAVVFLESLQSLLLVGSQVKTCEPVAIAPLGADLASEAAVGAGNLLVTLMMSFAILVADAPLGTVLRPGTLGLNTLGLNTLARTCTVGIAYVLAVARILAVAYGCRTVL